MQLACTQGNLPVVLTLWGLGLPKGIDMMAADDDGNTPVHYSALADNAEVFLIPFRFFTNNGWKTFHNGWKMMNSPHLLPIPLL